MTTYSITAYDWVPDIAKGQVRDLRLRWALEEAGLPYDVELVKQGTQTAESNLSRQPFGQIPTMARDGEAMFESGACVWRIAEQSAALLPQDERQRDLCLSWVFAALNSIEPPMIMLTLLRFYELDPGRFGLPDAAPAGVVRAPVRGFADQRLQRLAAALDGGTHLVGDRFTVADLMVVAVLVSPEKMGLLDDHPAVQAYFRTHTKRQAYRKAIADQLATFAAHQAAYSP